LREGLLVRKILSGAALGGALLVLVVFVSPSYRQGERSIAGKRAPEFSFTLAGKPARLEDLRGKVVVLNFWATWCPPCVEETPSLNRLQEQIVPIGGMVLGISVDEDEAKYEQFLVQQKVIFPNYRDTTQTLSGRYGTSVYPETYIIDRDGKIARKMIGPQKWDDPEMVAYVRALLAAK
jgi:cytochrome c biogenesis protein CcmG/thiol:disulfide interchange protein DsbE